MRMGGGIRQKTEDMGKGDSQIKRNDSPQKDKGSLVDAQGNMFRKKQKKRGGQF